MLLHCFLLAGSLCVPDDYAAVTRVSLGPITSDKPLDRYDEAESKRRGIDIFSWSSDSIRIASPVGLDRVCAGETCVYYKKHCSEGACDYALSAPVAKDGEATDLVFGSGLNIRARSPVQFRAIVARLDFVVTMGAKNTPLTVPLAQLSRESPDLDLTRCMRSIWVEGCSRPVAPQLRRAEHP